MLHNSQYASSKKYEARIYLSRQFKTNPKSKYEWIFEHFPKSDNLSILELGCGTGLFWLVNRNNIVKSWSIILSDYSEGMLETTRNNLSRLNYNFQYEIVNAENIQYQDNKFDIVLANNMLYHIQNRFNGIYDNVVVLPEEYKNDFKIYLQNILEKDKTITTTKDEGIFICKKE
jgi:ubiquinone/menaquinone biosynthesis C-methylase UbiE